MKPERVNDGEGNRKIENKSEMPFGSVHAGEISDATESYIRPAASERSGY